MQIQTIVGNITVGSGYVEKKYSTIGKIQRLLFATQSL